ncbi:MAG TPA: GTP-dependent dephospho-CoA kinase family protein [Candidatus Dormibacteraeota bacterium]|nr:GTP-dependent dephospho-CoA kinase family protein [Candidatus Dormibacteraeota bacterium]
MTTYVLPERLRTTLRRPLGDLVQGSDIDLGQVLRNIIKAKKPTKLILVGDSVSKQATRAGIAPDVMIIDNLEKRQRATACAHPHNRVIKAKNQAGKIEHNARLAVEQAIRGEADLVEIEGEEDLLAIIAVIAAPVGSLVVYGQPNEGVVLVRVSAQNKLKASRILEQMDRLNEG